MAPGTLLARVLSGPSTVGAPGPPDRPEEPDMSVIHDGPGMLVGQVRHESLHIGQGGFAPWARDALACDEPKRWLRLSSPLGRQLSCRRGRRPNLLTGRCMALTRRGRGKVLGRGGNVALPFGVIPLLAEPVLRDLLLDGDTSVSIHRLPRVHTHAREALSDVRDRGAIVRQRGQDPRL